MDTSRTSRLLGGVLAGLATIALLAGCSAGGGAGESSGVPDRPSEQFAEDYAPESQDAETAPDAGDGAAPEAPVEDGAVEDGAVEDRAIITTTSSSIRVQDVPGSVAMLEELVKKYDGRVESRAERTSDDVPEAQLTIRVPADQHDAFVAELKGLGEVMYVESAAEDVTLVKVDLESRIESLKSSLVSLRGMLEEATTVEDMLEVEREIADREAELQSLEAQFQVLSEDVAMSTVHVTLSTDAKPTPIDEPSGFFAGLVEGWNDFVDSLSEFVTDLGYALPGLLLFVLILAAIWFFLIRRLWRLARRRLAGGEPGADADAGDSASSAAGSPEAGRDPEAAQEPEREPVPHAAAQERGEETGGEDDRDEPLPPLPPLPPRGD
ncbi:DUF4349 domain-containing protein [Gulosibacter sp. 10]|uniref:DUF4349 domain-containing protein n=1 Tax=Gulosibacter sp. 10 TaxID=1255570 RepID=UPI00097EFFF0|nr:DUF4349 domain-containing protein [Gulosibacter sp. 10]SJM70659.1 putative lipoprotein [Gulosibacter sp. 10]